MSQDRKNGKTGEKHQLRLPFVSPTGEASDFSIRKVILRKAPRYESTTDSSATAVLERPPEPQKPPRPDPRKAPVMAPSIESCGIDALQVHLDPERHPSLRFSCADKLLREYAGQIIAEKELAVAYPCLSCRGGLSLFLAYIPLAVEKNSPGEMPAPVLVYPGTAEMRETYIGLTIKVNDLLIALKNRRMKAYLETKRSGFEFPWEDRIRKRIKKGEMSADEKRPLHAFFPAAILKDDGEPKVFKGRDGFGRGDNAPPPLHFATRIEHVSPTIRYRAAFVMHDALVSRAERKRLYEGVRRINADSVIHMFESPFSPIFRKMKKREVRFWRICQEDFPPDGKLFLSDNEILEMLGTKHRIHDLPSPLVGEDIRTLSGIFSKLKKISGVNKDVHGVQSGLYGLYRLLYTLPVPVVEYDSICGSSGYSTVEELISETKIKAEILGPGVPNSLVNDSAQILRTLHDSTKSNPSRARALLTEARRAAKDGRRLGIVVNNHLMDTAIGRYLSKELNCDALALQEKNIHIVHVGALRAVDRFDTLLFPGYRGGRALRWIVSGRAKEIVVLATESERNEMSRDLEDATGGKDTWVPKKSEGPMEPVVDKEPVKELGEILGEPRRDLPSIPLDDDRYIQGLMDYTPSKGSDPGRIPTGPRKCRKVVFRKRYAFLPAEDFVTIVGDDETKEKKAKDLVKGDVVVFIDHAQSRTIYDLMLDEIRKSPEYTVAAGFIQGYHRRLNMVFRDSGLSYAEVHRRLSKLGTTVVEPTVASWIRGKVMAPREPDNLGRIFKVFEIEDPGGTIREMVDSSARRLRTVYQQYAKAVNAFLYRSATDDRPEIDDLLEKYNLDIAAVRESVVKEVVESVSDETFEVPNSTAGKLYVR